MARPDILNLIDRSICGRGQVPARLIAKVVADPTLERNLILSRIKYVTADFGDELARALATATLVCPEAVVLFPAAVMLGIFFNNRMANGKNHAGLLVRQSLAKVLDGLGAHLPAVEEVLTNRGLSAKEVGALDSFPYNIYSTELYAINMAGLMQIITPLLQAAALSAEFPGIGLGVAILGLMARPLGQYFYEQADLKRRFASRNSLSARAWGIYEKLGLEHVKMTNYINLISDTPRVLLALYSAISHGLIVGAGVYKGLTEGLSPLMGILGHNRAKVDCETNTLTAIHIFETISEHPFILTQARREEHIGKKEIIPEVFIRDGVIIKDFKAVLPNREETKLAPLNIEIETGKVVTVGARSGSGKTETVLAICHLLEHTGFVGFVCDNQVSSAHKGVLNGEIDRRIVFLDSRTVNLLFTIPDLFIEPVIKQKSAEFAKYAGDEEAEMAWRAETQLLKAEIQEWTKNGKSRAYRDDLKSLVEKIVDYREQLARECLQEAGGNMEDLTLDRTIGGLSDGERQRLYGVASLAVARCQKPDLIILDEPLARLDADNKRFQLEILKKIQKTRCAIIIISHDDVDILGNSLGANHIDLNI